MLIKIARICTLAAIFTPLLLINGLYFPFISGKAIIFRILVELALAFFLAHILLANNRTELVQKIKTQLRRPINISVIAFALIAVITALISQNPTQAFWSNFERGEGAFQIMHYALFFILSTILFSDQKTILRAVKATILTSILLCIYGFGQLYFDANPNQALAQKFGIIAASSRISGTLGNPSYLAGYLIISIALIIYMLRRAKRPFQKILWGILAAIEAFALLQTGTRGALLAVIVGIFAVLIAEIWFAHTRKGQLIAFSVLTICTISGIGFLATNQATFWKHIPVVNRFLNISGALKEIQPRLWTWGSAVAGVIERPLTGWGAENFPYAFDKYYNPKHFGIESFFDRTHNVFLEYLISGGVLLLLAYLAIFFFYYKEIRRYPRNLWKSILFALPIAYFTQGFFLFDVLPVYIILYTFIVFAINLNQDTPIDLTEDQYELNGTGLLGTLAVATILITSIITTAIFPFQKNIALANAHRPANGDEGVRAFQAAYNLPSPIGQEETVASFNRFIINIIEGTARANPNISKEAIRSVVDMANQWFDLNRSKMAGLKNTYTNGGLNLRAGILFNQPDYLERSQALYREALEIAPTRIEFIAILLKATKTLGDNNAYEKLLTIAKQLRPDIDWSTR
jgi:O-antigen ligase